MSKRYLVTYKERNISFKRTLKILEMQESEFKVGTSPLAAGKSRKNSPVHFHKLGISALTLTKKDVERLSAKKGILAVEEDIQLDVLGFIPKNASTLTKKHLATLKAGDPNPDPVWNIKNVKAPEAWALGYDGTGINLAILDTGIAAHPNLVISGGVDFTGSTTIPAYSDLNGHGTHCAGIAAGRYGLNGVYGVAKNCNLYAVKVLGPQGGSFETVFTGMQWCIDNNMNVASMSLGGQAGPQVAAANAVQNCQTHGVTVVVAAGNWFMDAFPWVATPANSITAGVPNASPIAVAAVDSNNQIADFSSRGGQPDVEWNQITVSAPGVDIYSTSLNNGYEFKSGTSMACPHVAGLAVLAYQKYQGIQPSMVKGKIATSATNLGGSPYPNIPYGYGIINCFNALK